MTFQHKIAIKPDIRHFKNDQDYFDEEDLHEENVFRSLKKSTEAHLQPALISDFLGTTGGILRSKKSTACSVS